MSTHDDLIAEARTTNRLMVALIDQLTGIAVGLRDAEQLRIRPYLTGDEWKRLEVPDE